MGKDAIRALSLANLLFLPVWRGVVDTATSIPSLSSCLAVVTNVLLLALLFWVTMTLVRRSGRPLALRVMRLALPLVLLSPLNEVMRMLAPTQRPITELITLVMVVGTVSVFEVKPVGPIIGRASSLLLTVTFPFFLLTFGQVLMLLTHFVDKPSARRLEVRTGSAPRALWLVFDEMDQGLVFSNRPAGLHLPELDRFRSEALYASHAYPPADQTMISLPALLMGRLVSKVTPANPSELMITFAGTERPVKWSSQPTVFSRARQLGFNTALVGWYFPYCRIIGESLTRCSSYGDALTFSETLGDQVEAMVDTIPVVSILWSGRGINDLEAKSRQDRERHTYAYQQVLRDTDGAAVDPGLGLVVAHLPVPHPPGILEGEQNGLALYLEGSYLDNLQLVDRALGQLRRRMEQAEVWDNTIVLVTADHWWRPNFYVKTQPENTDHRVPFLLKLPGQTRGSVYDHGFNTVATQDLLLALLRGELSTPESVEHWLDDYPSIKEDSVPQATSK
jgi:Sulfatase